MNVMAINFFLDNWPWFVAFLFLILIGIFFVVVLIGKKKKKPQTFDSFVSFVGGISNITSVSSRGSRLSIELKNNDLVNNEELKNLGVYSIIKQTSKTTFLIGEKASLIAEYIQTLIN